jgi:hypothetical protein
VGVGALVAFIALLPSVADALYEGALRQAEPWTLEITPATAVGTTAVTVFGLTDSTILVMEIVRVGGDSGAASFTFGATSRKIRRISINVDPSRDSLSEIRITQGTTVITVDVSGDEVIVLDVVP